MLSNRKVVLYTTDMEPITVLEITAGGYEMLMKNSTLRVPIIDTIDESTDMNSEPNMKIVEIRVNKFRKGDNEEHILLVTKDEENALLLKSTFLAGQSKALNDIRSEEYAKGFMNAISDQGDN